MENVSSKYCFGIMFQTFAFSKYCPVVKIHLTVHMEETRRIVKVAELAKKLHKGKKFLHWWQKSVSVNLWI